MELHNARRCDVPSFLPHFSRHSSTLVQAVEAKIISSFAELSDTFLTNFIGGKKKLKLPTYLNNIVEKEGELLKGYIERFNFESLQVRKHLDETALNSIIRGVRDKPFLAFLDKNPPTTLAEFMARSNKYTEAEETRIMHEAAQNAKVLAKDLAKKELTRPMERSLKMIEHVMIKKSSDSSKKAISESTSRKPELRKNAQVTADPRRKFEPLSVVLDVEATQTMLGKIMPGALVSLRNPNLGSAFKKKKMEKYCILFTDEDAQGIYHPHDDALVVNLTIANRKVFRILVDTGSSADVLFNQAFDKMGVERSTLRPVHTPLIGFSSGRTLPEGVISLPLTASNSPHQATVMVDFLIVDQSSVYNAILGQPSLSLLQAVVSTCHLFMKFLTESGLGVVRAINMIHGTAMQQL
ncbi:uncharacterized protein LOC131230631 [Magnolia sinica]|uniref:uncharacterized protein LOC131230631 n=1 Tax=Magnolia sinica TaxID=86752 RepID=UPI002659BFF0|nr:uncharacterized protein LOC131230631 [Magnolia sinica]